MDFWGAVRTLRRRWYIAVPSAVVAVAVAAGMFLSIPTRYQSSGVMVLTTPAAGGTFSQKVTPEEAVKINPLLAFDGSLATTSQILSQILADPKTREQLGITKGSTLNYTVTGGGQNGPFLFVLGDSDKPEEAEKMVTTVLEFAAKELEDQQRKLKAPESTFITSQVIVNPTEAEAQIGGKVRYAGAAFVVLMLLTTAATFGADSIINNIRRRRERDAKAAEPDEDGAPGGGAPGDDTTDEAAKAAPPKPPPTNHQNHGPLNGAPRRPPGPPMRRPQPTASEQTVKVQAPVPNHKPNTPPGGLPAAKPGGPAPAKPTGQQGAHPDGRPAKQTGQPTSQPGAQAAVKPTAQPTASERTVKIAVPPPAPKPTWPTNEDRP
ncbi:hypothetical protein FHS29_006035 [Saccharothrix tamanrassetensis]|uniref:Capsular polysaccharide biosynthesis protein n=1 Tax=Saccharothrix tamanrassetensis TaxID=1051531 RepID=A0A841CSW3_9PSEU|nr:hypothetical protein [Saccharothrix tamanrassetensis]MBB5959414.1 hypothetical protein [Saccharothrix tamanrassetensis]